MSRETFAYQSSDATSFSRHHHGERWGEGRRTAMNKWFYGGVSQLMESSSGNEFILANWMTCDCINF